MVNLQSILKYTTYKLYESTFSILEWWRNGGASTFFLYPKLLKRDYFALSVDRGSQPFYNTKVLKRETVK